MSISFLLYNYDLRPTLTTLNVISIQKKIIEGRYILSPLKLFIFTNEGDIDKNVFRHRIRIKDAPNIYLYIKAIPEDDLVLMGLGLMLNTYIVSENLLMENSLGFKSRVKDYHGILAR